MKRRRRIRTIKTLSILPNLLTTFNLLTGFLAVIASINGHFERASLLIFLAIAIDSIDGRIARMTRTTSNFGREYDSLSDLISFGIAPSVFIYMHYFHSIHRWGLILPFLYLAGVALRLARFNIQSTSVEKFHFTGLPSPAGAGLLVSSVMFSLRLNFWDKTFLIPLTFFISLLMVSRIRFRGFKEFDPLKRMAFPLFFLLIASIVFVLFEPVIFVFSLFFIYTISGLVEHFMKKALKKEPVKEGEVGREDIHI